MWGSITSKELPNNTRLPTNKVIAFTWMTKRIRGPPKELGDQEQQIITTNKIKWTQITPWDGIKY
jgi:hypothetical protein